MPWNLYVNGRLGLVSTVNSIHAVFNRLNVTYYRVKPNCRPLHLLHLVMKVFTKKSPVCSEFQVFFYAASSETLS